MSGQVTEPTTEILAPRDKRLANLRPPWPKGVSGNPGGVAEYHEARRICADHSVAAVRKQIELMDDDDHRIAFMACEAILRRGIGEPRDHSKDSPTKIDLSALNSDDRASLAALLKKALGL